VKNLTIFFLSYKVIADFDFTLTKFHVDGVRKLSCHGKRHNIKLFKLDNKTFKINLRSQFKVLLKITQNCLTTTNLKAKKCLTSTVSFFKQLYL
jgi:hypothetical protein